MITVQYPAGLGQVKVVFRVHAPRNLGQPVQVIAGDAVFRRALFQHLQFFDFILETILNGLGRIEFRHALFESFHVGGLVILGHAQLALNHFQLFLQEELPLVLLDLGVNLFADFRL